MLDQVGTEPVYNNISQKLRDEIEARAKTVGRYIKYKFMIAKRNPDGELKTGGEWLYPLRWSLTPITFSITDPYDRIRKRIGMVKELKEYGAVSDRFGRVHIDEQFAGVLTLDLEAQADQDMFMFLELHPKFEGGQFRNNNEMAVFRRIDEVKEAKVSLTSRENRATAMFVASQMATKEILDFTCAMGWDEHEDVNILRDRVMALAENDPDWFKNFIDNKSIEFRAIVKRAMDKNIITWQPVENKFVWSANNQTIAILDRCEDGKVLERMSDWLMTAKNGQEVYTKIKGLLFKQS